ncbi:MAG: acyltransferase family protein [Victivallales bacterium]|nr:acyltransferase family protein [Victivallales bacterium]
MDSSGKFNLNIFAKKLAYYINLLLPPCHLKPNQLDGGNSIIRIVAISCVVFIHLNTYLSSNIYDLFPIKCCCSCCFWAVPAFICLSGKLIPIQIPYKLFYKKTFNKIFLPTIFWSILFSIIVFFKSEHSMKAIINNWINCRPFFHLWFMFMLCGIYLFAPLCSILIKKIPFRYLLPLIFLVMCKPDIWDSPPWCYPLFISIPYIFLFMTGSLILHSHISTKIRFISCLAAFCYLLFMGIVLPFYSNNILQYPFHHYLGFFGYLGGTSITIAFLWIGTFIPYNIKVILYKISQLVYGVYFIHPLIITLLIKLLKFESPNCLSFFIIYIAAWIICFMSTVCCKKIPFLERFL